MPKKSSKKTKVPAKTIKTPVKTTTINRCIVLFGLDKEKKPRGAYFPDDAEAIVSRFALHFGLRVGIATSPDQMSVARKLPKGDVDATDRNAIPEIHPALYQKLNDLVGGEIGVICTSHPVAADQIGPSHLVLAEENLSDGWWPAFVVRRHAKSLVLKWRDFPAQGEFFRDIHAVALLSQRKSEPRTPE